MAAQARTALGGGALPGVLRRDLGALFRLEAADGGRSRAPASRDADRGGASADPRPDAGPGHRAIRRGRGGERGAVGRSRTYVKEAGGAGAVPANVMYRSA